MGQTFKERLELLMKGEKPYTWARKVGIEKGLFQYYWQKGNIPTYENLIKIKKYTSCSLDWLLTGNSFAPFSSSETVTARDPSNQYGEESFRMEDSILRLKAVYESKVKKDIKLLETLLENLSDQSELDKSFDT